MMKKTSFVLGIVILVLSLGLTFVGCENETTDNIQYADVSVTIRNATNSNINGYRYSYFDANGTQQGILTSPNNSNYHAPISIEPEGTFNEISFRVYNSYEGEYFFSVTVRTPSVLNVAYIYNSTTKPPSNLALKLTHTGGSGYNDWALELDE
jgi:hypothetical protein